MSSEGLCRPKSRRRMRNKRVGDDTKGAARQSPNYTLEKQKIRSEERRYQSH